MIDFKESHRQRLIVSADDFGISPRANRNILYLISLGKINRVGVMVNGLISEKEISQIAHAGVKLDIHLNILSDFSHQKKKDPSATRRIIIFLARILKREISTQKVRADWEKQIEQFREIFGKYPDGINSHEHIHFFPPFFSIALDLQKKYGIPYIRFGNTIEMPQHTIIAYVLNVLRILNRKKCGEDGCISSNSLVSLDWIKDVDQFMDSLPEGSIEIVCHPQIAEDFVKIKNFF